MLVNGSIDSQVDLKALARVDLLACLDPGALARVARHLRILRVPAGRTIVEARDASRDVYLVLAGRLKVTIFSESGREVAFRELRPGDSFGEIAAIDGGPRSASVVAVSAACVAVLPGAAFRRLLREEPAVNEATLVKLARLVRALSERIHEFTGPIPSRVYAELLRRARDTMTGPTTARLAPAPTDADIASLVVCRRESVSRVIGALCRGGITRRQEGALLILDVPALARLAASAVEE